ncbi:serine/threonine-protein phosphatase 6 regulatory subunit 3-like [Uloborus diversus]|uniref:serine/threonine-protein phosphatase 6 regulatory subunit 3-like n=1 Tax=Uloborus diversus TaxID=327109 RepID=UPI002409AF64|nr:serine/threonine-protein phosphatase 6 regulatory subunit 3-like [Uloborus diversus]
MFWRYNLITGSCIETLLDKENVTLKELMEEEDILQECKAQTKKLLDFLVRPDVLDEMVTLITEEPDDEGDERLRYRHANRACELLTFDIAQINDALVGNEAVLEKLYRFLDTEKALNPLLASFFSKTLGLLISKKTDEVFKFLKERNFIALILNHLNTSAVMDLLLRFVSSVENNETKAIVLKWLDEQKLIQQLISRIDVIYDEDFNCNASYALCDIIKVSREHMSMLQEKAEPNPLLETLESVESVSDLLNHMFRDISKESAIVNGISVLLSLLMFKKQGPAGMQQIPSNQSELPPQADNAPVCFMTLFRNSETEQMTILDAERLSHGVNNVLKAVIPRLDDFHNLLLNPPLKPAITLTIGRLDPPLGLCRLEVAHLLTALLSTNDHNVNAKLASLDTMKVLIDMFFKYSWNNFLHTQVEQAIGRIITNNPTADEEGNKVHPLLDQVIVQCRITIKILESFEEDETQCAPGTHRKSYMGHLTKIANHVAQNAENGINSSFIKEKMKELTDDHLQRWDDFVTKQLAEINKKNTSHIVNGPPVQSSSGDEDSVDFRDIPFGKDSSVHLAFSDYQMHEMTSNFVDQFGFNDDEFGDADESLICARNSMIPLSQKKERSAELFEEVCRMKANSEGDAVLWADRENSPTFSTCFRMSKSSEENSSDSDEESQVFESDNAPIVLPSEEMKMDVDNQEGIFDGVPMDVAPANIPNPWESADVANSSSDEQCSWADFSNFSSFGASTSDRADAIDSAVTVEMETSDNVSCLKCVSNPGSQGASTNAIQVSREKSILHDDVFLDKVQESAIQSSPTRDANEGESSTLSNDLLDARSKSKHCHRSKDMSALFDEETCSPSSMQNGPV